MCDVLCESLLTFKFIDTNEVDVAHDKLKSLLNLQWNVSGTLCHCGRHTRRSPQQYAAPHTHARTHTHTHTHTLWMKLIRLFRRTEVWHNLLSMILWDRHPPWAAETACSRWRLLAQFLCNTCNSKRQNLNCSQHKCNLLTNVFTRNYCGNQHQPKSLIK